VIFGELLEILHGLVERFFGFARLVARFAARRLPAARFAGGMSAASTSRAERRIGFAQARSEIARGELGVLQIGLRLRATRA